MEVGQGFVRGRYACLVRGLGYCKDTDITDGTLFCSGFAQKPLKRVILSVVELLGERAVI